VFYLSVFCFPHATSLGRNMYFRKLWLRRFLVDRDEPLVTGVQTLRNATMAASFLASTSIIIAFGVLNIAVGSKSNTSAFYDDGFGVIKLVFVAILFFVIFLLFTMVLRYLAHLSFVLGIIPPKRGWPDSGLTHWIKTAKKKIGKKIGRIRDVEEGEPSSGDDEQTEDGEDKLEKTEMKTVRTLEASEDIVSEEKEIRRLESEVRKKAETMMNAFSVWWNMGLHSYYFAIPLGLWFLGSGWFLGGGLVTLWFVGVQDFFL